MASVDASDLPASNSSPALDDIDPQDFLKSIRELTAQREQEDLERYRKLEEEVAKSRAERAARRKERANSISPDKPHSSHDLIRLRSPRPSANAESSTPPTLSPSASSTTPAAMERRAGPPSPTKDIPEFKGFGSARSSTASMSSPARENESASQSASRLARSGTLTWQQRRPQSRGGSRPTSVVGPRDPVKESANEPAEPSKEPFATALQRRPASRGGSRPNSFIGANSSTSNADATREATQPSRDQISASLGSRDPSWFRQTADRGVGSAAYRRNKQEDGYVSVSSNRRGLPGMSRETSMEPERGGSPAPSESVKSETSRPNSVRDSGIASSTRLSSNPSASASSKPDLKSLIAEDEQQREASPMSDGASSTSGEKAGLGRTLTMSSSQSRLANTTERPSSPTKGMGGFVQSAMMKRSDSVSKRWSAQPSGGLSRGNSVASVRSGYGGLQGSHSMPRLEPTPSQSRESSNEPLSRPTSSSSNLTELASRADNDVFVKPALPHSHSRSKSVASVAGGEDGATSPPSSPSKRFSPMKSSWIESALTRPDSPKPGAPAATRHNATPSWMANIAKAKAERASAESTPRTGTPKLPDDGSRPASPTKTTPCGQGMLKRSESRDLAITPRSGTPMSSAKPAASVVDSKQEPSPEPAKPKAEEKPEKQSEPEPTLQAESIVRSPEPEKTAEPVKSPPPPVASRPKPEAPAKRQTDFRSTLRSRPVAESKQQDQPEFLSKFGALRKTQTQKYVAEDVFGNNIRSGKADLTKTGGPVKTPRRDELKESLLAKKEDWKKAKEEGRELPGQAHERKTSGNIPVTPAKPEALAKRDLLGRSDSSKTSPEKQKQATPEALARHKSLKDKPKPEAPVTSTSLESKAVREDAAARTEAPQSTESTRFAHLSKQTSAPGQMEHKQPSETSKLASRFNPGLAGMLARGPPPMSNGSNAPSRSESPALPSRTATPAVAAEEPKAGEPLQDMRKGRARGPKKRKGGTAAETTAADEEAALPAEPEVELQPKEEPAAAIEAPVPVSYTKPRAPPGSAASIMIASLRGSPKPQPEPEKPTTPAKPTSLPSATRQPSTPAPKSDVPEFGGFRSQKSTPAPKPDDNKENTDSSTPSVKSTASFWGRAPSPKKAEAPPQIQLPSKDEDAAMRSAGLLASSPARPSSREGGLGISVQTNNGSVDATLSPPVSASLPPKPAKSSRSVSGQLQEASPNKGALSAMSEPQTEAGRLLMKTFGSVPQAAGESTIDVRAVLSAGSEEAGTDVFKTLRKNMHEVTSHGTARVLPQQEEYIVFSDHAYVCVYAYATETDSKRTQQVFVWNGSTAPASTNDAAQTMAKKLAREVSSPTPVTMGEGYESAHFLQALGGILITRRKGREGAPKQYMLCGRKYLGHIAFDEVDFGTASLCSGFVYLISYPVTLQETKLYLWKGSACSAEELSAARLAAMDLSETGEIIEVDEGAEFASFLKIFGRGTMKANIPKPTDLWKQKAVAPDSFTVRLYRIQQAEQRVGLFASMFTRRPSWQSTSRSPSRDGPEMKVESKHISPFTQADLEAEGIYVIDAWSHLYVLFGPLFATRSGAIRDGLLGQALHFAEEYASIASQERGRKSPVRCAVLFGGVSRDLKMLFRHWDEGRGLWGTGGLLAGSQAQSGMDIKLLPVNEVLRAIMKGA